MIKAMYICKCNYCRRKFTKYSYECIFYINDIYPFELDSEKVDNI